MQRHVVSKGSTSRPLAPLVDLQLRIAKLVLSGLYCLILRLAIVIVLLAALLVFTEAFREEVLGDRRALTGVIEADSAQVVRVYLIVVVLRLELSHGRHGPLVLLLQTADDGLERKPVLLLIGRLNRTVHRIAEQMASTLLGTRIFSHLAQCVLFS